MTTTAKHRKETPSQSCWDFLIIHKVSAGVNFLTLWVMTQWVSVTFQFAELRLQKSVFKPKP